jgi:hypothetical protein
MFPVARLGVALRRRTRIEISPSRQKSTQVETPRVRLSTNALQTAPFDVGATDGGLKEQVGRMVRADRSPVDEAGS